MGLPEFPPDTHALLRGQKSCPEVCRILWSEPHVWESSLVLAPCEETLHDWILRREVFPPGKRAFSGCVNLEYDNQQKQQGITQDLKTQFTIVTQVQKQ